MRGAHATARAVETYPFATQSRTAVRGSAGATERRAVALQPPVTPTVRRVVCDICRSAFLMNLMAAENSLTELRHSCDLTRANAATKIDNFPNDVAPGLDSSTLATSGASCRVS